MASIGIVAGGLVMFYVLNEPNNPATHRINTMQIAHISSHPTGGDTGRIDVEIKFSGDTALSLTLDQTVWEKFIAFLHDTRRVS